MRHYLTLALAALLSLPVSAQTVEKNQLTFTKEDSPELGEVYSLGDSLFADAKDFDSHPRIILYKKADMKYRHDAIYGSKFDGMITEDFAKFPGKFSEWVKQSIVYPKKAMKKKIEGKVSVGVIIGPDGKVLSPKFAGQPNELLAAETLRLLSIMPAWTPAQFNGRKAYTSCMLDFTFELPAKGKKK